MCPHLGTEWGADISLGISMEAQTRDHNGFSYNSEVSVPGKQPNQSPSDAGGVIMPRPVSQMDSCF